jgi:hypothetical protein
MHPTDEFRIKLLTRLRQESRSVPIETFGITNDDVPELVIMRDSGWIAVRRVGGRKCMLITEEGRRILKCFERMYR